MSIEKVKEVLQKEKNRQVLLVDTNSAQLAEGLEQIVERFASDLDINAAKAGVMQCIAAAKETGACTLAQAEYELTEMVNEYEARIADLQTELQGAIANAAALNEELTRSFETINLAEQETAQLKAQVEALTLQNTEMEHAGKTTADALRTEVAQLKAQAQTYKAQYEAAIASGETLSMDNPAQNQYDPPATPEVEPVQTPKNIYEQAAAMLRSMKGK